MKHDEEREKYSVEYKKSIFIFFQNNASHFKQPAPRFRAGIQYQAEREGKQNDHEIKIESKQTFQYK